MSRTTFAAVLSFLAIVAAQHEDDATASTISAGCQRFLDSLDVNPTLATCLASINTATAAFNSSDAAASASPESVESALNGLCSSTACGRDDIVNILQQFSTACPDELVSEQLVSSYYDMAYNLVPMRAALCTKDGSSFCALKSGVIGDGATALQLPEGESAQIVMANLDAVGTANAGFLFLNPQSDPAALCSACFQDVLAGYVAFEDAVPYPIGVSLSPLLQGQAQLWQAVTSNCSAEVAANVAVKGGAASVEETPSAATSHRVSAAVVGVVFGAAVYALSL